MPAQANLHKHAWTHEDRILLGVMNKFFDLSRHNTALLFNTMTKHRLASEGLPRGLSITAIDAQLNDMKRTARGRDFQEIQAMPLARAFKELHTQKVEVEATAQALRISLKLRLHAHETQQRLPSKRTLIVEPDEWSSDADLSVTTSSNQAAIQSSDRQKRLRRPGSLPANRRTVTIEDTRKSRVRTESTGASTYTSTSLSSIESDSCSSGSWVSGSDSEDEVHLNLDENDFGATATRMNPRLSLQFNNQGKVALKRPRLLFRAFDPSHGLRARHFLAPSARITQPPSSNTEFGDLARRHLCEDKTFSSPLLSFTQSPTRALKIIAKDKQTSKALAIIDFNDLEEKITRTYGAGNGPWFVPNVCGTHDLKNLTRIHDEQARKGKWKNQKNYTGTGEFLVWEAVETHPVAILNHREALRLHASMESIVMSGINYQSGKAIAPSLNKVRNSYRGVVGYQLLRSFKVAGYHRGSRGIDFEQFIRGIYGETPQPYPLTSCSPLSSDEEDWVHTPADGKAPNSSKLTSKTRQSLTDIKKTKIVVEIPSKTLRPLLLPKSTLSSKSEDSQQLVQPTGTDDTGKTTEKIGPPIKKSDIAKQSSPSLEVDKFTEELLQYAAIPSPTPPPPSPVKEQPKRHRASALDVSLASTLPAKASPISAIDLTVEDDQDSKVQSAAPRRQKIKAPETSAEVVQVVSSTMGKIPTTKTASRQFEQSSIRNHFAKVVKSGQRPDKSPAGRQRCHQGEGEEEEEEDKDGDDDGDEEDDLQIISETTRTVHHHSYLRKTTRTRTTTVLTVRSRSLSESVNVNVNVK